MQQILIIFSIIFLGYLLGSITIREIKLGSSAILLVALIFGHFHLQVTKEIQNLGLVCFVTSVGFIAGESFIENLKSKVKIYLLIGIIIVSIGSLISIISILKLNIPKALAIGLLTGALTSTPGLAAAVEATGSNLASIGYGIAYPFGIIGVVLFVQIAFKRNEDKKILQRDFSSSVEKAIENIKLNNFEPYGLAPFAFAIILGMVIASIKIRLFNLTFTLGLSGAPLLTGIIIANIKQIGKINLKVPESTLNLLRELGLILFLIGAGTKAGEGFVETFKEFGLELFILGALITTLPMIIVYFIAKYAFKITANNILGAICGGMTSTPALGTLLEISNDKAVVSAYASTYPIALIFIVIVCQMINNMIMII